MPATRGGVLVEHDREQRAAGDRDGDDDHRAEPTIVHTSYGVAVRIEPNR